MTPVRTHSTGNHGQTTRRRFLELSTAALTGLATAPVGATTEGEWPQRPASATTAGAGIDLPALTIVDAARQISKRQLSPVELTQAVLARVEALNPKVGAFITVAGEHALTAARAAEREIQRGNYRGPLHGIPVGVKDTYYTKGIRTTAATPVLENFVPDFDAAIVERLTGAGGILIGKLNLPEWSFGGYTPGCNNPWDLTRNAGGSSGGAGAALAASMLLGATGGDTSGSIRNPASTCGVVGLKPTFGLVSRYGVVPISWSLDHLGPMAKTVEDTAILLGIIAGYDARDRSSVRVQMPDYRRLVRNVRGMRLGVIAAAEIDQFHPEVKQAFADAVKVLQGLGAEIREVTFPARMKVAAGCQRIIRICDAATYHRQFLTTDAADEVPLGDRALGARRVTGANQRRGRLAGDRGSVPAGPARAGAVHRRHAQGVRTAGRIAQSDDAVARTRRGRPAGDVSLVVERVRVPGDFITLRFLEGAGKPAHRVADLRQAVSGCAGALAGARV